MNAKDEGKRLGTNRFERPGGPALTMKFQSYPVVEAVDGEVAYSISLRIDAGVHWKDTPERAEEFAEEILAAARVAREQVATGRRRRS